ncbi:MAG TPA: LPS assembly lipoprotein LptE [Saprospiraceae bacterium]|nr:LPS assembly lipoprotein LptE [Saprospiraceae bacterium]HMP15184.1 LPS assembly lipoprotein LptE [Saprospiraceae bacterium]
MICSKWRVIFMIGSLAAVCCQFFTGCYSLSGISISQDVKTYYVEQFRSNADNAPPTLEQTLTEALKEKIRTESRLIYSDTDPHVEFKGTVVDFRVTSEAPRPGEFTAINRLTINVAVDYKNNIDKKEWKSNFSFFFDFPSSQDLASIQDEAIRVISNQLMEDIFNKAFTDW